VPEDQPVPASAEAVAGTGAVAGVVAGAGGPVVLAIAPLPPLPKAAYHCGNPEGFFPVVEECNVEWVAVGAH